MASSSNSTFQTPSTLTCTLVPQESILPFISDDILAIVLPTVVYAIAGGFFHLLDVYELFSNYRIHPSEDELKRNHVSKWQCLVTVVRYHILQISLGLLLNIGNGPAMVFDESCRIHKYASSIRRARNQSPALLSVLGVDGKRLIGVTEASIGMSVFSQDSVQDSSFSPFDLYLAKFAFHIGKPLLQYALALAVVDTWIYFTHRLCHVNKTLYRLVHAQHHRIYVSYAYGAVYAHWLETLFLDILSFILAGQVAQLSARQSMVFGSLATIKTISDHCGYVFPWDPLGWLNGNGAGFHDLHHQNWGLKYNFSTYTMFWDNLLGTTWTDKSGAEDRYQRVHEMFAKRGKVAEKGIETTDQPGVEGVATGVEVQG